MILLYHSQYLCRFGQFRIITGRHSSSSLSTSACIAPAADVEHFTLCTSAYTAPTADVEHGALSTRPKTQRHALCSMSLPWRRGYSQLWYYLMRDLHMLSLSKGEHEAYAPAIWVAYTAPHMHCCRTPRQPHIHAGNVNLHCSLMWAVRPQWRAPTLYLLWNFWNITGASGGDGDDGAGAEDFLVVCYICHCKAYNQQNAINPILNSLIIYFVHYL